MKIRTGRRAHWAVVLLSASGAMASPLGCSRTPPEPAPASPMDEVAPRSAPASVASVKSAPALGERCVTPLPTQAAAIPPVASLDVCPKDPEGIPKAKTAEVSFPEGTNAPRVTVELAQSEHDITRGLMYRRSMPEDHGMLFLLDERKEHTFWMHNTCMPLDMLFVDEDGLVVGIVEAAQPLTDSSRTVGCASSFVLEVNAGWSRRHGVKPGQKMAIPPSAR